MLDIQRDSWATSNYKKKSRLVDILSANIGAKPIAYIIPADILSVIRPIEACGKNVSAHVLPQTANQICRYAGTCGYCVFNAADGLTSVLRPIQSRHYSCNTDFAEIGKLLRSIDEYQGSLSVTWALKIMPYVALRSMKLRDTRWNEIDFDNANWTVPGSRKERPQDGGGMKCLIGHTIPLASQVLKLFEQLRNYQQPRQLCFPGRQSASACISDMALLNALRRMGYDKEDMTVHGFRDTFSTMLNEKNWNGALIQM